MSVRSDPKSSRRRSRDQDLRWELVRFGRSLPDERRYCFQPAQFAPGDTLRRRGPTRYVVGAAVMHQLTLIIPCIHG